MKDRPLKEFQSSLDNYYSNIKVEQKHQEYNAVSPRSDQ